MHHTLVTNLTGHPVVRLRPALGNDGASASLEVERTASPETNSLSGTARAAAVLINKLHARYISNSALLSVLSLPLFLPSRRPYPSFESLFPVTRVMVSYSEHQGFHYLSLGMLV